MEDRKITITSSVNDIVQIGIIPGHFVTTHSHINTYVDLTDVKNKFTMAKACAENIAEMFLFNTPVDTIICLEGTDTLGSFIAQSLSEASRSINAGNDIYVITPELNASGQMIFRDNTQKMIYNKQILLLMSSVSTGESILQSMDCLQYYNGNLTAAASIFSAINEIKGIPVYSMFSTDDIPDYQTYASSECPMCKNNQKIDAMVNKYGYSRL